MTAVSESTIAMQVVDAERRIARLQKKINHLRHRSNITPHTEGDLADLAMYDWLLVLAERELDRLSNLS